MNSERLFIAILHNDEKGIDAQSNLDGPYRSKIYMTHKNNWYKKYII